MGDGTDKRFRISCLTGVRPVTGVFDTLTSENGQVVLKTKYGIAYKFNPATQGQRVTKIQSIRDRNGNQLTFTYNNQNQLLKVTDASGRFLTFNWSGNRLISVTDANESPNRVIQFEVDSVENRFKLTKITNALGKTLKFNYINVAPKDILIGVTDENGNSTSISVYGQGVTTRVATCLTKHDFSFKPNSDRSQQTTFVQEATETEPQITTYEYQNGKNVNRNGNCCGYKMAFGYDDQNNIAQRIDGNEHATLYRYDSKGNLTKITDPNQCVTQITYEPPFNQIASVTDKNGNVTRHTLDAQGNVLKIEHPLCRTYTILNNSILQSASCFIVSSETNP
jgi:YD repeat-containing protein